MKYPELDKIKKVSEKSNEIGSFLDWLMNEKEIELAIYNDKERLIPKHIDKEKLLAEYFEIDLDKAEKERVQILEDIRSKN